MLRYFWTDHENIPLVPVRDIFLNEDEVLKPCVWCGFYIMTVVIFMTHACLGWRNSRWHRTQISQGASLLCEVSRIPHFLSNRFGVDFFSSLRPLFTASDYRVSEMKAQRNCHQTSINDFIITDGASIDGS